MEENRGNKRKKIIFIITLVILSTILFFIFQKENNSNKTVIKKTENGMDIEIEIEEPTNDKNKIISQKPKKDNYQIVEESTPDHSDDHDEDYLFKNGEGGTASNYNFEAPKAIEKATAKDTQPNLKEAVGDQILINSYKNTLYFYNKNLQEYLVLGEDSSLPIIKDNKKELIFVRTNDLGQNILYEYNFKSYNPQLTTLRSFEKEKITYIEEIDDLIFYEIEGLNNLYYFPTNVSEHPGYMSIKNEELTNFSHVQKVGNKFITYSEKEGAFYSFLPKSTPKKEIILSKKKYNNLVNFSFINEKNWFSLLATDDDFPTLKDGRLLLINNENHTKEFMYILRVEWLDTENLLVLDNNYHNNLYLYNFKTREKTMLMENVQDFSIDQITRTLYYMQGDPYYIVHETKFARKD